MRKDRSRQWNQEWNTHVFSHLHPAGVIREGRKGRKLLSLLADDVDLLCGQSQEVQELVQNQQSREAAARITRSQAGVIATE